MSIFAADTVLLIMCPDRCVVVLRLEVDLRQSRRIRRVLFQFRCLRGGVDFFAGKSEAGDFDFKAAEVGVIVFTDAIDEIDEAAPV